MRHRTVIAAATLLAALCSSPPAYPAPPAQVPFDQAIHELGSADAATRLRTVQMLRDAAYLEAAVPLAKLVVDPRTGGPPKNVESDTSEQDDAELDALLRRSTK